jgi:hypothetical protein
MCSVTPLSFSTCGTKCAINGGIKFIVSPDGSVYGLSKKLSIKNKVIIRKAYFGSKTEREINYIKAQGIIKKHL